MLGSYHSDDQKYMAPISQGADALRKALQDAVVDKFPAGTVFRWCSAGTYQYAAIKTSNGYYYLTGGTRFYGASSFSLEDLMEIFKRSDVSELQVATTWEDIK